MKDGNKKARSTGLIWRLRQLSGSSQGSSYWLSTSSGS